MSSSSQAKLPLWRILKLGLFHIGSAMIDLLAFSVWNRVMIVELGLPATPVGLVLTPVSYTHLTLPTSDLV